MCYNNLGKSTTIVHPLLNVHVSFFKKKITCKDQAKGCSKGQGKYDLSFIFKVKKLLEVLLRIMAK